MGFIVGELLRSPFELIPDGNAPGLGFVQHLAGVFRETGGHGVGLSRLEKQQILVRPGFVKGVIHIPFPGHPVKQLCVPGQLDAVRRRTVGHELFHALLAVGRLFGPVVLGDYPPDALYHIGKAPGGQLGSLHGNRNRAPGNIFIYQSNHPFLWDNLSRSAVIVPAPPSSDAAAHPPARNGQ